VLAAPVDEVFAAFADFDRRRRWFRLPGRRTDESVHDFDFRVGGSEVLRGSFTLPDRTELLDHRLRYLDIVPRQRIAIAQELRIDDVLRSISLVEWEFTPLAGGVDEGTRVDYLEQYVFLDVIGDGGPEHGERRGGTRLMLNGLKAVAESGP